MRKVRVFLPLFIFSMCFLSPHTSLAMDGDLERIAEQTNPFTLDGFVSFPDSNSDLDTEASVETEASTEIKQSTESTYDESDSDSEAERIAEETDPFGNNGFNSTGK